jgi:hypothetical protein
LGACDTEPPTDVGYFDATVKARVGCIDTRDATPGYDGEWRIAFRQPSESTWTGDDWHAYNCPDNTTAHYLTGSPFTEQLTGLRQNRDYQYRLEIRLPPEQSIFHWYDSNGTEDGTSYDGFHTDAFPTVTPQASVGAFRDSEGVNTKLAFYPNPASDKAQVKAALQATGLRRIRDGINWFSNGNGGYDNLVDAAAEMAPLGIRADLGFRCDASAVDGALSAVVADDVDSFANAWENPNEVNNGGCGSNWQTQAPAFAHTWHDELAERGLDDRPIFGPSCGGSDCEGSLGNLSAWVDTGNIHPYRGNNPPETADNDKCAQGLTYLPGASHDKCVITEFGWSLYDWSFGNCTQNCTGSERVQATYILRAYLDHFDNSDTWPVPVSYVHQLADLGDDAWYAALCGSNPTQSCLDFQKHEAKFGLYKYDWTPRLAATALQRQNNAIGDGSSTLTPLAYQRTSGPSDLRTLVLRRGDGKYVIATWRPIATDPTTQAGNTSTTFQIPDAQDVQLVRPVCCSGSATVSLGANGTFTLNTSSEPQFFIVTPKP